MFFAGFRRSIGSAASNTITVTISTPVYEKVAMGIAILSEALKSRIKRNEFRNTYIIARNWLPATFGLFFIPSLKTRVGVRYSNQGVNKKLRTGASNTRTSTSFVYH
jgi:hypothetical protein